MVTVHSAQAHAQSRFWCGTQHDLQFDFNLVPRTRYCKWQLERCPETGKNHFQFHIEFESRLRFNQVRELLVGAHVEQCKNIKASRAYAGKSDTRVEGPWERGSIAGGGEKCDPVGELATRSVADLLDERRELWHRLPVLLKLRGLVAPERTQRTQLVYLWGDAGVGKSFLINKLFGKSLYRHGGDPAWWDYYDQQDTVLVDEYGGQFPTQLLLKLGDSFGLKLPCKGGFVEFNSRLVVFVSNLPPSSTLFNGICDEFVINAINRRFSISYLCV